MTNLTNFTDTLYRGLNNPECSFFVGATVGQYLILKFVIAMIIFWFAAKFLDVILTPFLNLLKQRIENYLKKHKK